MPKGDRCRRAPGQGLTHRLQQPRFIHAAVATKADPSSQIPQLQKRPVAEIGETVAAQLRTGSGRLIPFVDSLMITWLRCCPGFLSGRGDHCGTCDLPLQRVCPLCTQAGNSASAHLASAQR